MDGLEIKILFLFMIIFLLSSQVLASESYRNRYSDLAIDSGALNPSNISYDGLFKWKTDAEFVGTGEVKILPVDRLDVEMKTLRFFPNGNKNCYNLPFFGPYRQYIFRAGFYYGNYDGLMKPPRFRLEIDGHFWANVTTNMAKDPIFHEILYIIQEDEASVCLIRTSHDQVPFISSIEAYILYDSYTFMENNTVYNLHSRINYGANATVEKSMGFYEERYRRKWKSKEMPEYLNINSEYPRYGYLTGENNPPWLVMQSAIQAKNLTDSIYLSIDNDIISSPEKNPVQACFVFYFMDPLFREPWNNQTSRVEIYIDKWKWAATDVPSFGRIEDKYRVVSLLPVPVSGSSSSSANVTISPAAVGSTMGPLLNAMEVFHVVDVSCGGVPLFASSILFMIILPLCSLVHLFIF